MEKGKGGGGQRNNGGIGVYIGSKEKLTYPGWWRGCHFSVSI